MAPSGMRSLSSDERHRTRQHVIVLRAWGHSYLEIARQTGLSRTGVFNICRRHEAMGASALQDAPNGHKAGMGRLLKPDQEHLLRRLIAQNTPDQLSLTARLWTRASVTQLIEQRFGLRLLDRTTRLYLTRWGYGSQPRLRAADEPSPGAYLQWLTDEYPDIANRARVESAEIHWGHEERAQHALPVSSDVVGDQPDSVHGVVLSSTTNRGHRRWMGVEPAPSSDAVMGFLRRLVAEQGNKLFLIHGNLRVHEGEALAEWLGDHDEQLEIFCPPGHAGERAVHRA